MLHFCLIFSGCFCIKIILSQVGLSGSKHWDGVWGVYLFPRPAMTKYPKLGGSNNTNVLSYSSGVSKSEIQVWQGWFLWGWGKHLFQAALSASGSFLAMLAFLGLWQDYPNFCLQVHAAFSLCVCLCVQLFPFIRPPVMLALKPILLQYDPIRSSYVSNDSIFR